MAERKGERKRKRGREETNKISGGKEKDGKGELNRAYKRPNLNRRRR